MEEQKKPNKKRENMIHIRLEPEQAAYLKVRAEKSNKTLNQYIIDRLKLPKAPLLSKGFLGPRDRMLIAKTLKKSELMKLIEDMA